MSHLSLEELIAAARGEPPAPPAWPAATGPSATGPTAAGHLADCEKCAAEVSSWRAVNDGVRALAARHEPGDHVLGRVLAVIDTAGAASAGGPAGAASAEWHDAHGHRAGTPGSRRRGYARLSAAAAVVALAGGGYGLSQVLSPAGNGSASAGGGHAAAHADAALTSTGCSSLTATGGTLASVSGSTLTIRALNGTPVTVTTTASTRVLRAVTGTRGDITDGARVTVFGANLGTTSQGTTIAARSVTIGTAAAGPGAGMGSALPLRPAAPTRPARLWIGVARGTVADATGSGFTVDEPGGSRVRVVTSDTTRVATMTASSIGRLTIGALTSAVGTAGHGGTLAATMVEQTALAARMPPGLGLPRRRVRGSAFPVPPGRRGLAFPRRPRLLPPGSLRQVFPRLGCAQDAITTAYLVSLTG